MSIPFVSVIVPVFNHWGCVQHLLDALAGQAFEAGQFELLLVDNGSEALPEVADWPSFAHLLVCDQPGSYAARNFGAEHARGEVLAFTDADCVPVPAWVAHAVDCLREQIRPCLVAGGIVVVPRNPVAPTAPELYDVILGMPQERYVRRGFAITANLFVPRTIFRQIGGFDVQRFSGGDADFCRRAGAAGVPLVYCGSAIVKHPARDSLKLLITKVRRVKGGQLRAGWRAPFYVVRAFLPPIGQWWRAIRAPRFSLGQRLRVCVIQLRLWIAEMAEVFRLAMGKSPERR